MFERLTLALGRLIRKPVRLALLAAPVMALAACDPNAMAGRGPSVPTDGPVIVALLVPSGSGQASDQYLARNLENAARLAIADLNGVPLDLRVYQTSGNPAQAAAVATQAVNEGAKVILGPLHAEDAAAAGVAVSHSGVNVLAFSNNTAVAGGNVFVLGQTFENTADRLMNYAGRQGKRDMVVVYDPDTAGQIGKNAIEAAAAANGIRVTGSSTYELSQQGVVAAAPGIASSVKDSHADSVFFTAGTAGALPILTQLLRDNGVDPARAQYVGLTRWDIPANARTTPSLQGGWFAEPDPATTQQFEARYAAAYGERPHNLAALAYDGIAAIGALVKSGRPDALGKGALGFRVKRHRIERYSSG